MKLNPQQKLAVESEAAITVVIAGPGSGKTRVLVERIKHRIARGDDASKMIVLTFTNAGAHEIRQRIGGEVNFGYCGTVHGYCFSMLQKHGELIGYLPGGIIICTAEERKQQLLEIADRFRIKLPIKDILEGRKREAVLIHKEHENFLKRNNVLDYDKMLTDGLAVIRIVKPSITELLVDEAQDSGEEDWEIYKSIVATRFFIVGDPDQSIYAFRGGEPRFLVELATNVGSLCSTFGVSALKLEENYRSDLDVCKAANALIANNKSRVKKDICPVSEYKGEVKVVEMESGEEEIAVVTSDAMQAYGQCSVAILCRTNWVASAFRDCLISRGAKIADNRPARLPRDWQSALAALGVIMEPSDFAIERYLKAVTPKQDIRQMRLNAEATGKGIRQSFVEENGLETYTVRTVTKGLAKLGISRESMELILDRISLLPQSEPTLSDLLSDLLSHEDWTQEDKSEGIHVGTIHSAKGREWDCVFLPAWEEGIMPSHKAEAEEERRLAFVAITRARNFVVISHAETRTQWGKETEQTPSRFIDEANTTQASK